jgi:hypothetical protein
VKRLGLAVVVGAMLAAVPAAASAQISPGPLATAHAKLEGTLQCTTCHGTGGAGAMTAQCLRCHKDVAWLARRGLGLHGREGREACASCHPDHAGREFKLITWSEGDSTRFDHGRTGWPLDGRHAATKCADCHTARYRRSPAAALTVHRGGTGGWRGLDRDCATCHEDAHRSALGSRCLECHHTRDWKPAPRFDHARTDYPLTGKHAEVRCDACHLAPAVVRAKNSKGQPIPVYRPLPHQECSTCHADPHRGGLGAACATCHSTTGFSIVTRGAFDHDRTRYPLRGRHAAVACTKCHAFGTPAGKRPAFGTCTACHADPHAGTATLAGRPADCSSCHDLGGFRPAVFTVDQHRRTRYPLEGRHQQVACGACHVKNPAGVPRARLGTAGTLIRPAAARCVDCHADDHGGQLAGQPSAGDCAGCHVVAGWKPSSFSVASHARLRLPLNGRHAEVACQACHGPGRRGLPPLPPAGKLGRAGVALTLRETTCPACHVDPHEGRYAAGGARPQTAGCEACHDARRFRPSTIDVAAHAEYAFRLEGAHRAVPCAACHDELKRPARSTSIVADGPAGPGLRLTVDSVACETCHVNPHGSQFAAGAVRGGCERCHGVEGFRPAARFDHERDTAFPLKGAHEKVPCASCHIPRPDDSARAVAVYRPLSSKCESCHAAGGRRS